PTKKEQLQKENLESYRNFLLNLKILDPACGSGAFLNQALDFLIHEHETLQKELVIMGDITAYYEIEKSILENNLYGVDINEDAVEIAKLSLWLRTASKGRELTILADKILCANSLLEMPFEEGSFDVVIGNPPYVRADSSGNSMEFREHLINSKKFDTLFGKWDLYIPFIELSINLAKKNGEISLIIPDAYCHADYAKKSLEWTKSNNYLFQIDYFPELVVFENVGVKSVIVNFRKFNSNKFIQRTHHSVDNFTEIVLQSYPLSMRIDAKVSFLTKYSNYYSLHEICYSTKGIVGNSDEKKYKGEFIVSELLSTEKDEMHPKLYFEGKNIGKWVLLNKRWIEFNTERSPSKWSRKGFFEMFEGTQKLVTMRSPGYEPRTMLDNDNGYFNESAIGFKRWIDLKKINNKSLNNAYSTKEERFNFENISTLYTYPFLLAILNSSLIRYELNTNRRSNIHIYPEDWKSLKIPRIENVNIKLTASIEKNAELMIKFNKQLQDTKQNFLNEL
ncbi:MAG: N-6 DNA methylase, partial [Spirochaetota bacterium]|nr:N-6 DNA methylase [Spirochaetota bacterium]